MGKKEAIAQICEMLRECGNASGRRRSEVREGRKDGK